MDIPKIESSVCSTQDPPNDKKVRFASGRKSITFDQIDRQVKKKESEGYSCTKTLWRILTIVTGIVIFPLGLYWWWTSWAATGKIKPGPAAIRTTHPGQIFPTGGVYTSETYRQVWKETEKILKKGSYTYNQTKVNLKRDIAQSISQTEKWKENGAFRNHSGYEDTRIEVINAEPTDVAVSLSEEFHRTRRHQRDGDLYTPILINPTEGNIPRGYTTPSPQGELFRRTALAFCLDTTNGKQAKTLYPLEENEVIYSPKVPVLRQSSKVAYALYEGPVEFSILTTPNGADNLERLIYNQLSTACRKGHDALVIPAMSNPEAATLYQEMLSTYFEGTFRKVVFAIPDDPSQFKDYVSALAPLLPKTTPWGMTLSYPRNEQP